MGLSAISAAKLTQCDVPSTNLDIYEKHTSLDSELGPLH